jgi:hypothetical protein
MSRSWSDEAEAEPAPRSAMALQREIAEVGRTMAAAETVPAPLLCLLLHQALAFS